MKRKKWSEAEEKTLLTKYADLVNAGTLSKLKTREKKFKPIAEHVNQIHHHQHPNAFPFKWSWRDVTIKVQNMRHQYLNVKQKIRISDLDFNWDDADNHWENFSHYKDVFGDVDLVNADNKTISSNAEDDDEDGQELGIKGVVLEMRGVIGRMDERARKREFDVEELMGEVRREKLRMDEDRERWEEEREIRDMEDERKETEREKREVERWMAMGVEMEREEKMEEEEMEWRAKMLRLQIEHEKSMMRMYENACQNQMQIVGVFGKLLCQVLGSANDGLGVAPLPQNMPGDDMDDDNVKPEANSLSQIL